MPRITPYPITKTDTRCLLTEAFGFRERLSPPDGAVGHAEIARTA
jgi:hypothetical protein